MSILYKVVILINLLFSLIILCPPGYCSEWVYVGITKDGRFNSYYNNKDITFYDDNKIKVWVKQTYSQKVQDEIDKKYRKESFYTNLKTNEDLFLTIYDYYSNTSDIIEYIRYANGNIKDRSFNSIKSNIIPGGDYDIILDKILKDYNIKRK